MAQTSIRVRTVQDACVAVGWSGHRALTIERPEHAGGMGLGFNGGELLLLAIGGCYSNDIFREAAKRGIVIKSVHVDVEADWDLYTLLKTKLPEKVQPYDLIPNDPLAPGGGPGAWRSDWI